LTECVKALSKAGVADDAIEVVRVPGAFEIPLVARQLARSGRFDAVICLGAVIRGDTPHFEYISREVTRGILQASMESNVPVIFGVLTTDTVAQALERLETRLLLALDSVGGASGNAGFVEATIFIFVLLVGLVYLWRIGALDWAPQGRGQRAQPRGEK